MERRFGGLRRLYGAQGAQAIFDAHVVVVGIGGVGSWSAEALARSGVRHLTLVDMDHVAESNVNRQIHALGSTLGQSKIEAMRDRIQDINPICDIQLIDDFVTPDNAADLLQSASHRTGRDIAVLDACDQVRAKASVAAWSLAHGAHHISVGAAGGKCLAQAVELGDLFHVTHDPLLAQLRYRLRKHHGSPRAGVMGVHCVFSRENVVRPEAVCNGEAAGPVPESNRNCHGYGSSVTVTATFGMVAAGALLNLIVKKR